MKKVTIRAFVGVVVRWREQIAQWLKSLVTREMGKAHCVVYPGRNFIIFGLVALTLWYAAASQNSGLAYLLLFWLLSLGLVSIVHARANVGHLQVRVHPPEPTFADESPLLRVEISNGTRRPRYALRLELSHFQNELPVVVDKLDGGATIEVEFVLKPVPRGIHRLEWLEVHSRFPLQILTGRSWFPLSGTFLVFPKLAGTLPLPAPQELAGVVAEQGNDPAGEDFSGVRRYELGDSQRHIDWKAVARGHPMYTKQFTGVVAGNTWLEWLSLEELGYEARLSQLAKWCCEAEWDGRDYGLHLPRVEMPPSRGESHLHECLRMLALYRVDP